MATSSRAGGPQFEIWMAGARVHSIDNPVRIQILGAIEQKPRTLNDLVALTKKAKSTLSAVHLASLLETGLVEEATDPKDARVKWYKLVGHRLGASSVEKTQLRDAVLQYVHSSGLIPLGPLLEVLNPPHLVSDDSLASYAQDTAKRLGQLIGRMLTSTEPKDAAREVTQLLEAARLGRVEWAGLDPKLPAKPTPMQRFAKAVATEAMRAWRAKAT